MTTSSPLAVGAPGQRPGVLALVCGGREVPYHPAHRDSTRTDPSTAVAGSDMTGAQVFASQLPLIERVIDWVCARRALRGAEAEDFASTVKLRLIENDYEILARFEGRSSLQTYVTAVVHRLYIDYQNQRFGKWRSSAQARRLGPVAVRLERLLYRDGLTFEEARGVLQTDLGAAASADLLDALRRDLPVRVSRARRAAGEPSHDGGGLASIEQAERRILAERTCAALRRALDRLPARDRIVLRMHVEGGLTVADVARALGEDQKALYRKWDALLAQLRGDLGAEGIDAHDARELLATLDWDGALADDAATSGPHDVVGTRSTGDGEAVRQEGEP